MDKREQIAEIIGTEHYQGQDWKKILAGKDPTVSKEDAQWIYSTADQILSLFKEQIEKLQPLSDEELRQAIWEMGVEAELQGLEINQAMRFNAILLAQLAKDKDALRRCE